MHRTSSASTTKNVLGNELRRLREQARFSQEELAFRAGLHRTYISLLERGLKSPTIDTLFRLADALKASPSKIVEHLANSRKPQSKSHDERGGDKIDKIPRSQENE